MSEPTTGGVLTQSEAAAYMGVSTRYVYDLAEKHEIDRRYIGKKPVYFRADLDAWLATLPDHKKSIRGK